MIVCQLSYFSDYFIELGAFVFKYREQSLIEIFCNIKKHRVDENILK